MLDIAAHGGDEGPTFQEPIPLPESAAVLSHVVRSLYPSAERPQFHFSCPDHAVSVLLVLEKYDISSWFLQEAAAAEITAADPPIRAWALAVRAKHDGARAAAVRAFISTSSDRIDYDAVELGSVDAWSLLHLLRIKQDVTSDACAAVEIIIRASFAIHNQHDCFDALRVQEARQRPFAKALLEEEVLAARATGFDNHHCRECRHHFTQGDSRTQREFGRRRLDELMEQAVRDERGGLAMPTDDIE